MQQYLQLVDGQWCAADDGASSVVVNPATEEDIASVPASKAADAQRAMAAAKQSQRAWARMTGVERAAFIVKAGQLMLERIDAIATAITQEQGKPLAHARMEVMGGIGHLNYHAEWARRMAGSTLPADRRNAHMLTLKQAYGVVVSIIPWNFPIAVLCRKIAPALMAGNAVVAKPAEATPVSALLVARCFVDAGLPAGVLNVLTGRGREVGEALVTHPDTQIVTLTGSVEVGQHVMRQAAEHLTLVSLELGGKAPFIVMDDADLEQAATDCVMSRFRNAGQICTSNERTYVHASVFDKFVQMVVERTQKLRVGNPMGEVDMGPKINRSELEKVERMVQQAIDLGGKVLTGGTRPSGPDFARGHWFAPTVMVNVEQKHPLVQEEVFGPVLPILPFDSFDEVLDKANDSDFGLSAYFYGNNYNHVMRVMSELDSGEIFVNRMGPESVHGYHTGYRMSGIGGDDGPYGFETYLKKKTVYLQYAP